MAAELIGGAFVGAILNELILLAKRAYRCRSDCENLVATLESVKPLLTSVEQSADLANVTSQAWLKDVHSLLLEATSIVQNCDKNSRCSFLRKFALSSKIQNIDRRIYVKLSSEVNLVTLNLVQGIDSKMPSSSTTSSVVDQPLPFELQQVPSLTVAFDNNPFKKLKDLVLSVPQGVTKTFGVKGKGGAGKTLLAKMVNNDKQIQKKYVGSILWITIGQDVSISLVYKRMGKFLSDGGVFERDISGRDLEAQRTYLMEAFKQKRVLMILDDVWGNTEKNCGMIYWLDICKGDGSTTLITTRDNSVLDRAKAMERIEVKSLSKTESWKLFSFHAFQPSIVPPSLEVKEIAMEICNECKGLPLALEVIGSALWDKKDERDWRYALSRLKKSESWTNSTTMEDELFHRLQFSYDVLSVEAKKCFLYFAAFPEDYRIPVDRLCHTWRAEDLFGSRDAKDTLNTGRMNLITLADHSLIDFDKDGEHAKIHDVLRDLALRIIRDAKFGEWAYECQFEPGKVLETLPRIKETTKRVSFIGTHVENFDPQSFVEGHNLQVCMLSPMTFGHGNGSPKSLPGGFFSNMSHLSYLNLSKWTLEELPESIKELKALKYLDLSFCKSLKELPESIKGLKSLTHLFLSECESLVKLSESIKELMSLTHLSARFCTSLKELPNSIGGLMSLTYLSFSGCDSLKEIPDSIKELKCLLHFNLSDCKSLKELPESFKELKRLTYVDLNGCKSLEKLPQSFKELKSLTFLDLRRCESLKELSESIKELKSLMRLLLSGCKFLKDLPESIKELKSLIHLDLSGCENLYVLPESIKELKSLMDLNLSGCKSLKELPESIKELESLIQLNLSRCESLKELPKNFKDFKSLKYLGLKGCKSLKELPESIKELKSLKGLDLSGCKSLKEIPKSIEDFKCLTYLNLSGCESLEVLPESIKGLKSLTRLDLIGCKSLKGLPEGIKELNLLQCLTLGECKSLKELPESINGLKSLIYLDLRGCEYLKELPENIKELKSLKHLDLSGCKSLKELPESIKELQSLTYLNLSGCDTLKELPKSIN